MRNRIYSGIYSIDSVGEIDVRIGECFCFDRVIEFISATPSGCKRAMDQLNTLMIGVMLFSTACGSVSTFSSNAPCAEMSPSTEFQSEEDEESTLGFRSPPEPGSTSVGTEIRNEACGEYSNLRFTRVSGHVTTVSGNGGHLAVYPYGDDGGLGDEALVVALVQAEHEAEGTVDGVAVSTVKLRQGRDGNRVTLDAGATYFFPGVVWASSGDWIETKGDGVGRGVLLSLFRPASGTQLWVFEPGKSPRQLEVEPLGSDRKLAPWRVVGWDSGSQGGVHLFGTFRRYEEITGRSSGPQEFYMYRGGKWSRVEVPATGIGAQVQPSCLDLRIARAGDACKAVGTLVSRTRFGSLFEFEWSGKLSYVDVSSAFTEYEFPERETSEAFITPLLDNGSGDSKFDGFAVTLNNAAGYPAKWAHFTSVESMGEVTLGRLSMENGFESIGVSRDPGAGETTWLEVQLNSALLSGRNGLGYLIQFHSFGVCEIVVIHESGKETIYRDGHGMSSGGQLLGSHVVVLDIPGSRNRGLLAPSGHIFGGHVTKPKSGQLSIIVVAEDGEPMHSESFFWAQHAISETFIVL